MLDGIVSDEKLSDLLALGTEYPELDFKDFLDPGDARGAVEIAVAVGAMQVRGGYVVIGVDNSGSPTGSIDGVDGRRFDEANLSPKLLTYLSGPLQLRTNILECDGHCVVLLFVGPHPAGCAFFRSIGQYEQNGRTVIKFQAGDVFWRNGTRSERLGQDGFEEIFARRLDRQKRLWLAEHQELRQQEQADLAEAYRSQQTARGPLGAVNADLEPNQLISAVLEFARGNDDIAFRTFLNDATDRAGALIDEGEVGPELADILDKLACVAAVLLRYERQEWFCRAVDALGLIYDAGFTGRDSDYFGYSVTLDPKEVGPQVWLMIVERIYGIGALAVRLAKWEAVRYLATLRPPSVGDYYGNWLRFGLTMASRAQHLMDTDGGQQREISLLSRAKLRTTELACLRPDGVADDALLTNLAQFDVLANLAAVTAVGATGDQVFYPSWARFYQSRIDPIVEKLLTDPGMRQKVTNADDPELARALRLVARHAANVGISFDGFRSWDRSAVISEFIARHPAPGPEW